MRFDRRFSAAMAAGPQAAMTRLKAVDWVDLSRRARPAARDILGLVLYTAGRFYRDRCPQVAASLTYTTLLSMVPLLTIGFAILAAFPAFEGVRDQAQAVLFENMVPEIGETISNALAGFTKNAGKTTAIGIVFVAVTSILTLNTIESVFNTIWRVSEPRKLILRVLSYWAMLTMAPLLFGASLSLSSYLITLQHTLSLSLGGRALIQLASLLPFLLSLIGFTLLLMTVPNFPVHRRNAIVGGVVTAVLFEMLKRGFGLYIAKFGSYQVIYGALAAVPIFMLWVYLCWMVVLFGAELTASLPEWRVGRGFGKTIATPGRRLGVALALLGAILHRTREGKPFRDRHLLEKVPSGSDLLGDVLGKLVKGGFVARGERGQWLIARDLEVVSLQDLLQCLELTLGAADQRGDGRQPWHDRLDDLLGQAERGNAERFGVSLKELLSPETPVRPVAGDVAQLRVG